jgi:uncharacterized membrane protein YcaP (DUF421 family)
VSLVEVLVRIVLIYACLLVLVRITGKKELGQLSPMDFLTILLLSETVSPALTKQDTSVTVGILAASTLLGLTALVDYIVFRSRRVEDLLEGRPKTLIENGRVNSSVLKEERISELELGMAIRREGVDALADVAKAVLEPSGYVSVIKRHR